MMSELRECQHVVVHLRLVHQRIRKAVRQTASALSMQSRDLDRSDQLLRIGEQLDLLRREIGRHFACEREGGYVEEAVSRCPSLCKMATELEASRRRLQSTIEQFVEVVPQSQNDDSLENLQTQFSDFTRKLVEYAAKEKKIVQLAFGTEYDQE